MLAGVAATAAAGIIMGQSADRGEVCGVTSYDEDGFHVAVGWTRNGDRLVPVARGATIHMQRSISLVDDQNIGHIAVRSEPARFAKDEEKQKSLLNFLDAAEHDSNIVHVREAYTKAMRLIAEQNVCPVCQRDFDEYSSGCSDIACVSTVFDRYVVCVRARCR
jgi:hypothetical protein